MKKVLIFAIALITALNCVLPSALGGEDARPSGSLSSGVGAVGYIFIAFAAVVLFAVFLLVLSKWTSHNFDKKQNETKK
ncbi:MAG: hypothetical protein IKS90_07895 [Clostridia bacterium]|nr:hypothetical protein [Clostridia bacterium]